VKGDERRVVVVERLHFLDRHHHGAEVALGGGVLKGGCAFLALKQELNAAQSALNLADSGNDAHRIQNLGSGFVRIVALRDREDEAFALERRFDGAKGSRASRGDRCRESRENDSPPQGENWESLALCHVRLPKKELLACAVAHSIPASGPRG
jgi:hypothetical protein